MRNATSLSAAALAATLGITACTLDAEQTIGEGDFTKADGKSDSSVEAIIVDFEFDGELVTNSSFDPARQIEDQLLYTVGHLNGDRSVGRLDQVELTEIETDTTDGGDTLIRYHARMPVAWGQRDIVPSSYSFALPRDVSFAGQQRFTERYKTDCVDWSAHDVSSGSMWYYYRPSAFRCELAAEDIVTIDASVHVSSINTTGKFPEYHKVWEDDVLKVVAVFGKYEDGATSNSDAGIAAYNEFTRRIRQELAGLDLVVTPADVSSSPGVTDPDIVFEATLPDGKRVEVYALLIDSVRSAGFDFDNRYGELSPDADLIAYNGHSGLGANIQALARKGSFNPGQYSIVFMNGCDTYAYVDSSLAEAHAAVNPDDPAGTKYMDMITNALPSFFHSNAGNMIALIGGLMSHHEPKTFEQMFASFDSAQVVLVSGEQDNEFVPGFPGGGEGETEWQGMHESGTVAAGDEHLFETPTLAAGSYVFMLDGTGDADLYLRIGDAPTTESFDCRPYKSGSSELCTVDLNSPAAVHVMVRGFASSSSYELFGEVNRTVHPL